MDKKEIGILMIAGIQFTTDAIDFASAIIAATIMIFVVQNQKLVVAVTASSLLLPIPFPAKVVVAAAAFYSLVK